MELELMPIVSTIIPAYNAETHLQPTIESALNQDAAISHEVIVINDGSTDGTDIVARSYYPKVKVYTTPNRGVSAARNLGIQLAQGRFICFLDADDTWQPAKLKKQLALFDAKPQLGTVICDETHISEDREILHESFFKTHPLYSEITGTGDLLEKIVTCLVTASLVPTSGVMVRRETLERTGCFDETLTIVEDRDMWLRLAFQAPFGIINESLVTYLSRQVGSLSSVNMDKWAPSLLYTMRKNHDSILRHLEKEGSSDAILSGLYNFLGDELWHSDKHGEAEKAYRAAVTLRNYKRLHKLIACKTGRVQEARKIRQYLRKLR
ncbi:glycosyltransferase family 2 protein [Ectothiorhodospira variabilis]|uniref:glycosyltransferase family 2 protein n=1 Tax=Ectothiorhodospira variabilis TaxID=505694 RepID=UPI001EFC0BD6|nr:glycosyltransferase family A protein [Ectothiorhodospira variabilis]MCG5497542.1 glycosyltransferase family 2 protein [Ectothiorhodospira variabilis]